MKINIPFNCLKLILKKLKTAEIQVKTARDLPCVDQVPHLESEIEAAYANIVHAIARIERHIGGIAER